MVWKGDKNIRNSSCYLIGSQISANKSKKISVKNGLFVEQYNMVNGNRANRGFCYIPPNLSFIINHQSTYVFDHKNYSGFWKTKCFQSCFLHFDELHNFACQHKGIVIALPWLTCCVLEVHQLFDVTSFCPFIDFSVVIP